jgi:hypothetical protein
MRAGRRRRATCCESRRKRAERRQTFGRTHAEGTLDSTPRRVELSVKDDGAGFDDSGSAPVGHYGLIGMRARRKSAPSSRHQRAGTGHDSFRRWDRKCLAMPIVPFAYCASTITRWSEKGLLDSRQRAGQSWPKRRTGRKPSKCSGMASRRHLMDLRCRNSTGLRRPEPSVRSSLTPGLSRSRATRRSGHLPRPRRRRAGISA